MKPRQVCMLVGVVIGVLSVFSMVLKHPVTVGMCAIGAVVYFIGRYMSE